MSRQQQEKENHDKYWVGPYNKSIRYWFYISRGLDLFNNFRYVFMLIFGIYFTLKLGNYAWLVVMFVIFVPILGGIGYLSVHHMGKVIDWLSVKFSTHYGKYQYELLEDQVGLLTDIKERLDKNIKTDC
jgi:hypothetical protein